MDLNKIFDEDLDNVEKNILGIVNNSVNEAREMQKKKVAENVQIVIDALKKIEQNIKEKYDFVGNQLEKRIVSIKDGRDGINGRDGKDGKDGRQGKDGRPGRDGKDGKNGLNGESGEDGVSVVNAHIDFDGSLIISLSSGKEINVGEVVAPALAEQIKVITNGGGTSQSVLDTLTSLQSQIDALSGEPIYKGLWNASTNSPALTSSVGTSGNFYIVSVAGSTSLDGITNWGVGDWAIFNGTVWQRVEGGAEGNFTTLTATGGGSLTGTWSSLGTVTTVDINGGTIDGAAIGDATPAAGAFTALSATGTITVGTSGAANGIVAGLTDGYAFLSGGTTISLGAQFLAFGQSHATNANTAEIRVTGSPIATVSSTGLAVTGTLSSTGNLTVTGGTVTTGSATALSLATSGGTVAKFNNTASAVTYASFYPSTTGGDVVINGEGEANTGLILSSSGSGSIRVLTGGIGLEQVRITHTASANRYITLTGSNGGNPTIGTSAGSLNISSSVDVSTSLRVINAATASIAFNDGTTQSTVGFNGAGSFGITSAYPMFIGTTAAQYLAFNTNSSERMRIDSSGNLGIGTTSPTFVSGGGLQISNATQANLRLSDTTNSGYNFDLFMNETEAYVVNRANGNTLFFTNNTERMRITLGGDLVVGTTTASGKVRFYQTADAPTLTLTSAQSGFLSSNQAVLNIVTTAGSSNPTTSYAIRSSYNGTGVFDARNDGTLYAQNTTVQSISDVRTKENIRDADDGLDIITALRPVRFDFKEGFNNNRKNQLGFIAQEIEQVFPDAVDVAPQTDENGEPYKSVGPSALIPVLVKAIQELNAKVEAQAAEIALLKSK